MPMAKGSITDTEIALIKAMLARRMPNKDIQFFFNRPDRSVNSGRITNIRDGSYGASAKIPPAANEDLDLFIASASYAPTPHSSGAPSAAQPDDTDPLSEAMLTRLFKRGADGHWRLVSGETDTHECKTSFGLKYPGPWLRAVAALANNAGGYIFFGVRDKGIGDDNDDMRGVAIGLGSNEFANMDPAELTTRLKSVFDPTPRANPKTFTVGTATIGVIHVMRHEGRPVIATRNVGSEVRESDIYFRYSGQSARIKYSDLRTMLDARDRDTRERMLPMVERMLQLGPERVMIADLTEGTLGDGKRAIQIDAALVDKLAFIKEGEFSEVTGTPTLRLIGDVQPNDNVRTIGTRLGLVTRADVLEAFLAQTQPDQPERYIRFAVEVGQGEWFPLHYFAMLAGISRSELIDFISGSSGTVSRKMTYIKRVQPGAAYKTAVGKPKAILARLLAGEEVSAATPREASHLAQAIEALPDDVELNVDAILVLLRQCLSLLEGDPAQSFARRAICRVDELLFASDTAPK